MASWPPRDTFGRIEPHRLNWISFFRALPLARERFNREVPGEFFAKDGDAFVVACPCGEEVVVPILKCVECECERFYLGLDGRILVANTPQPS